MTNATIKHRNTAYIREVTVNYRSTEQELVRASDSEQVTGFIRSILPDNSREHLVALYLDAANQIISYSLISTGTANSAQVHPREVYQRAVVVGSCALIVAHNHPSGSLLPSTEDRAITERLKESGELLGIKLLDSLILSRKGTYSITDEKIVHTLDPVID